MRLGFFLEDLAHEKFVVTLTLRVLELTAGDAALDVRNARGGDAIGSYYRFLQDCKRGRQSPYDLLVVCSDGNCTGPAKRRRDLDEKRARLQYDGEVIYAIPDPHIERWYLLDTVALARAAGVPIPDEVPAHKCGKLIYKELLMNAFRRGGITPLLGGGSEYGDAVATEMDLELIRRKPNRDDSLCQFIDDLLRFGRAHPR